MLRTHSNNQSNNHSLNQHRTVLLVAIAVLASLTLVLLSLTTINQSDAQSFDQTINQPPLISHAAINLNDQSFSLDLDQSNNPSNNQTVSPYSHIVDIGPPLTRQALGSATWALLHQMAAMYPLNPTINQSINMESFIRNLAEFYPCKICASHFRQMLEKTPPVLTSRSALSFWMCERHNEVNLRLGKTVIECAKVDQIWPDKLKDCGCEVEPETAAAG